MLRVRAGDLLRVRLVNRLAQPTNLHFHGIRTSPLGNSDNVHLAIAPGSSFTYEIRVPTTQPPGLYWCTTPTCTADRNRQVMRGLSGALVVDPTDEPDAAQATERPGEPERLFVLKNIVFDDDTGNATIDDDLHGVVQSINGALDANETMRPGETQRWRFTNPERQPADPYRVAGASVSYCRRGRRGHHRRPLWWTPSISSRAGVSRRWSRPARPDVTRYWRQGC